MFKVNYKDTRTTPMAYFTRCSNVSIVKFEHVNVNWVVYLIYNHLLDIPQDL